MKRTLTLRREHLADLTADELRTVPAGYEWTGLACQVVADAGRAVSNLFSCFCPSAYC